MLLKLKKYKNAILSIGLIFVLFALSVHIRKPFLKKELSDKGWVTAHVLLTVNIWNDEGPAKFGFSPVYVSKAPADKDFNYLGGVSDENGRFYYISYPPLTFIAPYIFFKATGIDADEFGIRLFNLLLHLLCAILIYRLILVLTDRNWNDKPSVSALFVSAIYLFASGNLFFHSEILFSDLLIQPLLFGQFILFFQWRKNPTKQKFISLLIVSALAIYTEWLGLFVLFVFSIAIFLDFQFTWKKRIQLLAIIGGTTFFVLGLIIFQYSSIAGWDALLLSWKSKYAMRSGHAGVEGSEYGLSMDNPESWSYLNGHLNGWYLHVINLIGIIVTLYTVSAIVFKQTRIGKKFLFTLVILVAPIFLHFFVFFNFNVVHDMGSVKIMAIATIILGLLLFQLERAVLHKSIFHLGFCAIVVSLTTFKMWQSAQDYQKNAITHFHGDYLITLGKAIQENAKPNTFVYTNAFLCPELFYYSKRNPRFLNDTLEQKDQMRIFGLQESMFFEMDVFNYKGFNKMVKED